MSKDTKAKAAHIPVGGGLLERARRLLAGRKMTIDTEADAAARGETPEERRRRRRTLAIE